MPRKGTWAKATVTTTLTGGRVQAWPGARVRARMWTGARAGVPIRHVPSWQCAGVPVGWWLGEKPVGDGGLNVGAAGRWVSAGEGATVECERGDGVDQRGTRGSLAVLAAAAPQ